MATPRIFIDASVWIAAAGSPTGASHIILTFCREGFARPVCSRTVLREAEKNIRAKLGSEALLQFYQALADAALEMAGALTLEEIAAQSQVIAAKDAHVLASALKAQVDVLLTLDRKHFLTRRIAEARLPLRIMIPGDFLRELAR